MAKGKEFLTSIIIGGKVAKSLGKALSETQSKTNKAMQTIAKTGKVMGKTADVIFAPAIAAAGYAVNKNMEFAQSLAKVSTLADTTKKSMSQLSSEVLKVSSVTGMAASEVSEALYEALSAGADTEHATKLVEVAAKSAIAGYTDTATAVDGLTTVLNAYGKSTQEADVIANQMLITQNLGKTTFGELASTVGKLAPIMNSAGLTSNDMFSSLAALTANGIQTSEAVSGMKAAISNIVKPTAEAAKTAKALGLDFSTSALKAKGLAGFLKDLSEKTGGNLDTMAKLFGSVEGLNSMLALCSENGAALLNESLSQMANNSDILERSFEQMQTPEQKIAVLKTKIDNLAIVLGEKLMPYIERAVEFVSNIDFDALAAAIEKYAPIILGIAAALKVVSIAIAIINAVSMASPVTWIILGIIAVIGILVGAFIYLWNKFEGFRNFWIKAWELFKEAVRIQIDNIKTYFKPLLDIIEKVKSFFKGDNDYTVTVTEERVSTSSGGSVPAYAYGGTVTVPHLAVVGDRPETIVPHGNSPRSRALLDEAARHVGGGKGAGNTFYISFAPVIYAQNGAELKKAIAESEEEFEEKMESYFKKREAISFA